MVRLLRTNAFRLAALYLVLFAASVLSLLVFIYLSMAGFVERQTEATINAEIRGLADQYHEGGLNALIDTIRVRIAGQQIHATLYLLTDEHLKWIAGNLSAWPSGTQIRPGWFRFPIEARRGQETETGVAVASVFTLPGGYHMLVGRDLRDAEAFRGGISTTLVWAGLLTLALGVAGGLFMTRNMLRRVETVNRTSERIMAGDLGQRVPLNGSGDEFDQLAANLNAMLDRIERLMTGMHQVTDNIAHDLRTPLARLRARIEVALLERADIARYEEVLRATITEADRLLGTFNALLKIAEAEAGSRRDAMILLDLAQIARLMAELYEPVAEEKGLKLVVATVGSIFVTGDRHLLSQAIANLLDNALKYTPSGTVTLRAWQKEAEAILEVADQGPGIPADRRQAVFDRFVRLEGSRSTPGNGLGLSLVRAVVRLHGGTVRLEDNRPGVKAIISLPLAETGSPSVAPGTPESVS